MDNDLRQYLCQLPVRQYQQAILLLISLIDASAVYISILLHSLDGASIAIWTCRLYTSGLYTGAKKLSFLTVVQLSCPFFSLLLLPLLCLPQFLPSSPSFPLITAPLPPVPTASLLTIDVKFPFPPIPCYLFRPIPSLLLLTASWVSPELFLEPKMWWIEC